MHLWQLKAPFSFSKGDSSEKLERTLSISYPEITYIMLVVALLVVVDQDDTFLFCAPGLLSTVSMSGEASYRRIRDQLIKSGG